MKGNEGIWFFLFMIFIITSAGSKRPSVNLASLTPINVANIATVRDSEDCLGKYQGKTVHIENICDGKTPFSQDSEFYVQYICDDRNYAAKVGENGQILATTAELGLIKVSTGRYLLEIDKNCLITATVSGHRLCE